MNLLFTVMLTIFLVMANQPLLFGGNAESEPVSPKDASQSHSIDEPLYVPGQVLVQFEDGASQAQKDQAKDEVKAEKTIDTLGPPSDGNIDFIEVQKDQSMDAVVNQLESNPAVADAEPNYVYDTSYTPNDPSFGNQWYLNNTGQTIKGQVGTAGADIKAPDAWDIATGGDITVAVIDSGIDLSHPDLASKIWQNDDEIAGNGIDDDGNGYIDDRAGYNTAGISQLAANAWWYFGRQSADKTAQSIKGTGAPLTDVGLLIAKAGSPTATINVSVRTSLTGPALSSATIDPSEVGPNFSTVNKQLNTPVTLNDGQTYYLVFEASGSDTNNYYGVADNYSLGAGYKPNPYRDGEEYWYGDGSWRSYPDDDLYFTTNSNAVSKDDNGHGTHVSGIIGAQSNNATGISGISQGVKIMPVKAGSSSGSLTSAAIIEGIYYATDNGAKVINMSFGGSSRSTLTINAVNYAYAHGVTLFASSGNSGGTTMSYPAGYDHVIGVGATNNKDEKASFSTYNSSVDISAPGQYVYSTMPTYPVGLNSYGYAQNYDYLSGTSMASPTAAGVAALLRARSPDFTPAQVEERMKSTADDLGTAGRDDSFGSGRVNALKTLTGLGAITGSARINSGAAYTNTANVTIRNSASSSNGEIVEMRFRNEGGSWSAWEPYAATKSWVLSSGEGAKTVVAEFKDTNGLTSQVSAGVFLDTVAPSASLTTPRMSSNKSKTARFKIKWAGSDAQPSSGIGVYDVQYKEAGGSWQDLRTGATATATYFTARPGTNYYFRVRAVDRSMNTGGYTKGKRTIVPYDNDSLIVKRRGFKRRFVSKRSKFYLGTVRYSTKARDSIVYRVAGSRVYLISTKGPDRSKAKIFVDGDYVKTINTHSRRKRFRQVVYTRALRGKRTHRIRIVNVGNRRRFDVDAIATKSNAWSVGLLEANGEPTSQVVADSLAVTQPTDKKTIPETPDFATRTFADPWDMSQRTDLSHGQLMSGLTKKHWGRGKFTAKSTGYATVHPLFAGYDGVVFAGRDGYINRISTSRYNRVSVRMYSSRRAKAKIYWFYNQTWNRFGSKSFMTQPGWHTYIINVASSGQWKGKPMGLRLDPTHVRGVRLKIDWIRLYKQSRRRITLKWTQTQPEGTTRIYLDTDKDPSNGKELIDTLEGSSGTYQWDPSAYAPDNYWLFVKEGDRRGVYSKRITINRPPLTRVLDPDDKGGSDYAAKETGDAWNMSQPSDVWYTKEMKNVTFRNGIMSGTPTGGDPHLHLRVPKGINTNVYHRMTFRYSYSGPFDYGGGTMVRTIWSPDHNKLELFQTLNDLPTYPSWETYTVDLKKAGIDGGNIGWNGIMNDFRFDPSEGVIRSRFHLDYIRIAADDTANRAFTIKWRDKKKSPRPTRVSLFYDTNSSGFNGRAIVRNKLQVRGVNKHKWNTRRIPARKYYIYAVADDGINKTRTYSSGPIVIRH